MSMTSRRHSLFSCAKDAQMQGAIRALQKAQAITDIDVDRAWKVLCPRGETSIGKTELLERLVIFMPSIAHSQVSYLAGQGPFTKEKLAKLLLHAKQPSEPLNIDMESWAVLDAQDKGVVDVSVVLKLLKQAMSPLGVEKLDGDDVHMVRLLLGLDPESRSVSAESWQQLGSWVPKLEEVTPTQRRLLAARGAQRKAK